MGAGLRGGLAMSVALSLALLAAALPHPVRAQGAELSPADAVIVDAREAWRKRDRARLVAGRDAAAAARHPLAVWPDYWELNGRLNAATQGDLDAFYGRWPGSYLEDRLRNDWLLELGHRRDWETFAMELPRYRMNDDREVSCYAVLVDHLAGKEVREAALGAWLAQRDGDEGCALLASTLFDAKLLSPADVWRKARHAVDAGRPRAARQAVGLLFPAVLTDKAIDWFDNPVRFLAKKGVGSGRAGAEFAALALMRLAAIDPDAAHAQLDQRFNRALPADLATWVWNILGKQAAMKLSPDAADYYDMAARRATQDGKAEDPVWPDETMAWKVRASLRADDGRARWQQAVQAINAMPPAEQRDPAWVYWKARGLQALAKDSQDGESMQALARELLASISGQLNFYGQLAAEDLGQPQPLPPAPAPLTDAERRAAAQNPGLLRALKLIAIGLRGEGVREWNFTLRGMGDRELLAAAQLACDREVWDRCISASDRTRTEVDMSQRFPTPFRKQVQARARDIGLDPAYVYGLIRQESRFIMDARSGVGASGLMQIMPSTARWTAKKIGLDYSPDLLTDRDTNIKLGTSYLKLVLDDFDGSQALAAAAYNAGPSRPRRWRDGPILDPAAWAENIPFSETRDYVKKVLSNAAFYGAVISGQPVSLKSRLGRFIGPRAANAPPEKDLP